jgi:beta-phosphoglucomutase
VKTALFDMDGVLVDSGAYHRAAWRALLAELGAPPADPEFWRLTIGRPVEEALPLLLGRRLSDAEIARHSRRKTDLYHRLADGRFEAVPGAVPFVRSLVRAGVPRALATSASVWSVQAVLESLELATAFPVIVTDEDVRRGKPDPEVYLTAAARLGVAPGACLVFEDSLVGIEAARRAGMRPYGLATTHTKAELLAAGAAGAFRDFRGLAWETLTGG